MARAGGSRRYAALRRVADEAAGQGLVEYLFVVCIVAIGLISVLQLLFGEVAGFFQRAAAALQTIAPLR